MFKIITVYKLARCFKLTKFFMKHIHAHTSILKRTTGKYNWYKLVFIFLYFLRKRSICTFCDVNTFIYLMSHQCKENILFDQSAGMLTPPRYLIPPPMSWSAVYCLSHMHKPNHHRFVKTFSFLWHLQVNTGCIRLLGTWSNLYLLKGPCLLCFEFVFHNMDFWIGWQFVVVILHPIIYL